MSTYDLLAAWFRVADWIAYSLSKDGDEGIALKPLGQFSAAATNLATAACSSANYRYRKIGGALAGWIATPPPTLLASLLDAERKRDQAFPANDMGRLDIQSAVEDLVFAATRWMRREALRPAAAAMLQRVVEDTLADTYWNTSSYAMTTLLRYRIAGADELLRRFDHFARTASVSHPSRPSLDQERSFAQGLLAKNVQTLGSIEGVIDRSNDRDLSVLDVDSRQTVEEVLSVAKAYDAAQRT